MFCFQCQETARNQGCTVRGVCSKSEDCANLQDLLIHILKGLAYLGDMGIRKGLDITPYGRFLAEGLFVTITNANFDNAAISDCITEAIEARNHLRAALVASECEIDEAALPDAVTWEAPPEEYAEKARNVGVLQTQDPDVRSLRETAIIGLKGIAAYAEHAAVLDQEHPEIWMEMMTSLASTLKTLSVEEMVKVVMDVGKTALKTMALLDHANTNAYGHPEITEVSIEAGDKPGILISGHDLKDMEELLRQTEGTGIDVYTHSEMLPANYYPAFKKYPHLRGNYGSSWWHQSSDFDSFNGAILMTTNCITPVKDSYRDRLFTTGMAGYPGIPHIPMRIPGKEKDFSAVIERARSSAPPDPIETGSIVGGFAHNQVMQLADKVIEAVKRGAIRKFVVMAGCDGRMKNRNYFTEMAEALPRNTVILTAGCAKYRYNKLDLGDIDGIPRVLDAGQCNDSYSLAVIAMKLQEAFELEDINDLPLAFDIAWYEQKAVAVLLALLAIGFKKVRIGPTLPAFLSPNVAKVLVDSFDLCVTTDVETDLADILA